MKKIWSLALVLLLVFCLFALAACNGETNDPPSSDPGGNGGNDGGSDADGTDDSDNSDENDGTVLYVTFRFLDPNGVPMTDRTGHVSTWKSVLYGSQVVAPYMNDASAFADYVIVGWVDEAGNRYGEKELASIKKTVTLSSVVREKGYVNVDFFRSDGVLIGKQSVKEGTSVDQVNAPIPREIGKYFKAWRISSGTEHSSAQCIAADCSFVAVMGTTDGIMGKIPSTHIKLDGERDDVYETRGAYVAHSNVTSADGAALETQGGKRPLPNVRVDSYTVWDGDFIYMIIEVWDQTLTRRSDTYLKAGVDGWCNDAVELWYTFERDLTLTENMTHIGVAASGGNAEKGISAKFAPGRNRGILGGRSTHHDEIEIVVRNTLMGAVGQDLDAEGNTAPSYIVEFKIPAYTEGKVDMTKAFDPYGNPLMGKDLEAFKKTGRLFGVDPSNNDAENYAFTSGEKLEVGDIVRFNIKVNDLRIGVDRLKGYFDTPTLEEIREHLWITSLPPSATKLYELTGSALKAISEDYSYTASGAPQKDVSLYLWFALGDETVTPVSKVLGFTENKDNPNKPIMVDTNYKPYTRK